MCQTVFSRCVPGVGVHKSGCCSSLCCSSLQDLINFIFVVHRHLLQTLHHHSTLQHNTAVRKEEGIQQAQRQTLYNNNCDTLKGKSQIQKLMCSSHRNNPVLQSPCFVDHQRAAASRWRPRWGWAGQTAPRCKSPAERLWWRTRCRSQKVSQRSGAAFWGWCQLEGPEYANKGHFTSSYVIS